MKYIVYLIVFSGVYSTYGEDLLKPLPAEVLAGELVTIGVISGYHFELTAPQTCDGRRPQSESPRQLRCQFSDAGDRPIRVSVCDDGKTFCKPVEARLKVLASVAGKAHVAPSSALMDSQTRMGKILLPDFEEVSPTALASNDKPVLVLVGADWCPTCNEMREVLLSSDEFKAATKGWRHIYVDGDSSKSTAWQPYMKFFEFPTVALLSSNLREVSRYMGPIRASDFQAWVKESEAHLSTPIPTLLARAQARREGSWAFAIFDFLFPTEKEKEKDWLMRWVVASHSDTTMKMFTDADVPVDIRAEYLHWRVTEDAVGLSTAEKVAIYGRILDASREKELFNDYLSELCDLDLDACKHWVEVLPQRVQWLESRVYVRDSERQSALVEEFSSQAENYERVGDGKNATQVAGLCAGLAEAEAGSSMLRVPRATGIARSYCLEKVGQFKEADKIYQQLMEAYPSEATFFIRYANFLKRQKHLPEAHAMVERAEQLAYGYNWMKAVVLKANIEIAMQKSMAAKETIQKALAELDLSSPDPDSRDQRLARMFRDLETKIH